MVIRLRKIYFWLFAVFIMTVSLFFTLQKEDIVKMTSAQNELSLPIVMYHHVTEKPSRAGKYVVLTEELESDLEFLKSRGYTCVTVKDLIDYTNAKRSLPEKIVMLTFDDGFESVKELAFSILKEKGMKAVASPVGSFTQTFSQNGDKNVNYAYMSWDDLKELDESDEFEVQNHTYDMHSIKSGERKGLGRNNGESADAYHDALKSDLLKMQNMLKEKSGINAEAVVYPYGIYSDSTVEIIKELGFKCSMVCEERINKIRPGDGDCLFQLGRFNRPSGISSEEFFKKLGIN